MRYGLDIKIRIILFSIKKVQISSYFRGERLVLFRIFSRKGLVFIRIGEGNPYGSSSEVDTFFL